MKQRILPGEEIDIWRERIEGMHDDIAAVLEEERLELTTRRAEMEATKAKNLLLYQDEIKLKPKKMWFQSQKEKENLNQRQQEQFRSSYGNDNDVLDNRKTNQKKAANRKLSKVERLQQQRAQELKDRQHQQQGQYFLAKQEKKQKRLQSFGKLPVPTKRKHTGGDNDGKGSQFVQKMLSVLQLLLFLVAHRGFTSGHPTKKTKKTQMESSENANSTFEEEIRSGRLTKSRSLRVPSSRVSGKPSTQRKKGSGNFNSKKRYSK
jgi:hypothetical protein